MATEDEVRWLCLNAAADFAARCKELRDQNPHDQSILEEVIVDLVTELWDRFLASQKLGRLLKALLPGCHGTLGMKNAEATDASDICSLPSVTVYRDSGGLCCECKMKN